MPGFTIHIAVGKRYMEKHETEIKNEEEFIKGTIAPDLNETMTDIAKDKSATHFGKWGNYQVEIDIKKFLEDAKVDMGQDYWKGYFLHLITDYYFYNQCFEREYQEMKKNHDKFYADFDCLNYELIAKYQIEVIDSIKKYMLTEKTNGKPKYLEKDKVIDFIEKISDINLQTIQEKGMEELT